MKNIFRTLAFTLIMLATSLSVIANEIPRAKAPTAQQQQRLLEIEARVLEI